MHRELIHGNRSIFRYERHGGAVNLWHNRGLEATVSYHRRKTTPFSHEHFVFLPDPAVPAELTLQGPPICCTSRLRPALAPMRRFRYHCLPA
jgi:hypothetical protein